LAKELSKFGIRVAAVAPGFIDTEMLQTIRQDMLNRIIQTIPMGRLGEIEEVSQAVKFIIRNDFFTGRFLEVDGGMRI
jgi:3-oxoacyl-[acyl-carrier protein] reductase